MATSVGTPGQVTKDAIDQLRSQIRGSILLPADPEYDSARKIFNGMIDRRPGAIVRCRDTADVAYTVRFARANKIPFTTRSGGHSVTGASMINWGLVLDLSQMRGVQVDAGRRLAVVQGGATWGDVDHATQLHGLAVPGGFVSTTGVAGFTLGGGIAWTSRKLGLACDNLLSVEMVTAKGDVIEVDAKHPAGLFWALRGAGSSFGIVTSFRFRLQRIGPMVYGGFRVFPGEQAKHVLRCVADVYRHSVPELNALVVLTTGPPAPFLPTAYHGKPIVVLALCYIGPTARGPAAAREFRELPGAIVDHVGPLPYLALQSAFDPLSPWGLRNYWKSAFLNDAPDAALDVLVDRFAKVPSPLVELHFQYGAGAIAKVPPSQSVIGNRKSPYLVNLVGKWTDPAADGTNVAYIRELWDALQPWATGGIYSNFATDIDEKMSEAEFGRANLVRLARLKKKFDPDDVFSGNHRIAPPKGGR